MASGTISGGTYNARYSYYMTWTSVSNGSVANTSNVTLNWIFKKTATDSYNAYNTSGTSKVTLTINGSSSGAMRADFDLRSASVGTTKTIATYTVNNIPHNSDGTCRINVSGSHNTGLNWGTFSIGSTGIDLDTIPRYASCSHELSDATETSITVNWTSDSYCDTVWYSTDNGSTWTVAEGTVGSLNKKNGTYTISSLSAGTSYNIKTRVRRKDSQLTTDSAKNTWSTYSYPYIKTVSSSTLTIGSQQTLTFYNPKNRTLSLYMKKGTTTSGTSLYSASNVTGTSKSFTPTASTLYSSIPNNKDSDCVYYVTYTDSSSVTHTSALTSGTKYAVNESTNAPSVSSNTPYDANDTTYGLTGNRNKIVLNASNLQLTVVANAKNSATFQNNGYIKVNGTSLSLTHSGSNATGVYTLNKPSSSSFTVELKDSRGIIVSTSITLASSNVVNYITPTIVGVAVRNQPTDGIINLSGSGKFYNGSFGNSSNTLAVTYKVVKYGTSTQLASGSMTVSKSGNTHSESQKQVSNATYTDAWTVTFTATDALNNTASSIVQVTKGIPIFNWDNDEFDVNVQLNAKHNIAISSGYNVFGQHGGSWYQGRKYAIAYNNHSSGNSYRPVCSAKSSSGDWSIGTYGGDDKLRAIYTTDANYDAGQNTYTAIVFPTTAGTLALTSEIPTVNNATLTIQKNGSTVKTFTANASSNVTANITVPTKTSELTNNSGFITSSSLPSVTNGTFTISKSSGNSTVSGTPSYAKYGNVVMVQMAFKTTSAISAGSNAFVGTISGVSKPKIDSARGCGFYSSSAIIWQINSAGELTVRVLSAQISSGQTFTVSGTYVCA